MSINTIKLTSNKGDLYIAPQQTLSYKGIALFGYGYLDWGSIVNQSIVNLMDKIDSIEDNGLSEIQFDLTEYEVEQKRLRTLEFQTWKSGFTDQLKELINLTITQLNNQIAEIVKTQNEINDSVSKLIEDNYIELRTDLNNLLEGLDSRILELVNNQLEQILIKIDDLTNIVSTSQNLLNTATNSLNETKLQTEQDIKNFKDEFSSTFSKFKNDTTTTLIDNKDYLIKYINEALSLTNATASSLEDRLIVIESLSNSLNSSEINNMIIQKVNELSNAIILSNLVSFNKRMETIEDDLLNMDSNIDEKISNVITPLEYNLNLRMNTLDSLMKDLAPKVVKNTNDLIPLNKVMTQITKDFDYPEEPIELISQNQITLLQLDSITTGFAQHYRDLFKNSIESILKQIKYNQEQTTLIENNLIKNLLDGLKQTEFDELSIIKRSDAKTQLETTNFSNIKSNLSDYVSQNLKFTYLSEDLAQGYFYFAFKLPSTPKVNLWDICSLKVKNLTTNEEVKLKYQIGDSYFNNRQITHWGTEEINYTDIKFRPFIYNYYTNVSQLTGVEFANMAPTDQLEFTFYKDSNFTIPIVKKTIDISLIRSDSYVTMDFKDKIFNPEIKPEEFITIPTITLPKNDYTLTNTKINIPVNKIITEKTGKKEFMIKVNLPDNGLLTKISYNDGFTDQTKDFINHDKFPLTETEYNLRNLGNTNNYYKDIGTTGLLYFPLNIDCVSIKATIYYTVNGVAETKELNNSENGSGISSQIVDIVLGVGKFVDIDAKLYFGNGIDGRKLLVDVKAYDDDNTSETYQMWLNGNNISTVGIKTNGIIRVYNEFTKSLNFLITIMEHKGTINGYTAIA